MILARSEQNSLQMDKASIGKYLSWLNSLVQPYSIGHDTFNNNQKASGRDQDGEGENKKWRSGQRFASINKRGLERYRKPPEDPIAFPYLTSETLRDGYEVPKSEVSSPVIKLDTIAPVAAKSPTNDSTEMLPIGCLTHLYTYYARIILQVQLQHRQIHQQRQILEHFFAKRSEFGCTIRQPEFKVRTRLPLSRKITNL